jgi:hypothetical protein
MWRPCLGRGEALAECLPAAQLGLVCPALFACRWATNSSATSAGPTRRNVHNTVTGQWRVQIKDAVSIRERPTEAADRAVPRHWEGDLLVGRGLAQVATIGSFIGSFSALLTPGAWSAGRSRGRLPPVLHLDLAVFLPRRQGGHMGLFHRRRGSTNQASSRQPRHLLISQQLGRLATGHQWAPPVHERLLAIARMVEADPDAAAPAAEGLFNVLLEVAGDRVGPEALTRLRAEPPALAVDDLAHGFIDGTRGPLLEVRIMDVATRVLVALDPARFEIPGFSSAEDVLSKYERELAAQRRNHGFAARESGPSSSSVVSCGVEMLELDAGVLGREPPVDTATGAVARRLPRRDLPLQGRLVGQPPV